MKNNKMVSKAFSTSAVITFIVLASIVLGGVGSGPCITGEPLTTHKTPCGWTVNSDQGQGGVELCGDCYACGEEDDAICPEDFGANCSRCCDPECNATLSGYVTDEVSGEGINGVTLTAITPHLSTTYTTTTTYDEDIKPGYYNFTVPRCYLTIKAEKLPDYSRQYVDFPRDEGKPFIKDFTMGSQTCSDDCTIKDAKGRDRCDPACNGISGCLYEAGTWTIGGTLDYNVSEACKGKFPSEVRVKLGIINGTHKLLVDCCDGAPYTARIVNATIAIDDNITNVYTGEHAGPGIDSQGNVKHKFLKAHTIHYTRE
ncbi:hypothetical protein GF367_03820 [Candidatus Woesearchaeota archaeon]|nr:hypothetical protein [Candidatus Woesearchaeota archaeon]